MVPKSHLSCCRIGPSGDRESPLECKGLDLTYPEEYKIFEGRDLALFILVTNIAVMYIMNSINVELLNHQIYIVTLNRILASRNTGTENGSSLENWGGELIFYSKMNRETNASFSPYLLKQIT